MLHQITSLSELRNAIASWKATGETIALVPTMGALHEGHLSLVRDAQKHASKVVVSIFVNPTQFGPNEDFTRYPRPLERDLALLEQANASAAWLPSVEEMYPEGAATSVHVAGITEELEGAFRPGHFDGVATIVSKLLIQVAPHYAFFGEKDYQQLCVIKRMVADLNIPTHIMGVPTMREESGLAMSSRNQYLSTEQRQIASHIYASLTVAAQRLRQSPANVSATLDQAKQELLSAGFTKIDYLDLRQQDSLNQLTEYTAPARLIVAAWLGTTRLIDNITVE